MLTFPFLLSHTWGGGLAQPPAHSRTASFWVLLKVKLLITKKSAYIMLSTYLLHLLHCSAPANVLTSPRSQASDPRVWLDQSQLHFWQGSSSGSLLRLGFVINFLLVTPPAQIIAGLPLPFSLNPSALGEGATSPVVLNIFIPQRIWG